MSTKTRKKGPTPQRGKSTRPSNPKAPPGTASSRSKQKTGLGGATKAAGAVVLGLLALAAIFFFSNRDSAGGRGEAGAYESVIG